MKSFIVFALVVAAAVALPTQIDSKNAVVEKNDLVNIGVDGYSYEVQTSDGKSVKEVGTLKNVGTENEGIEVRGEYSYYGDDGVLYSVTYIANEKGFQPQGAHLPVSQ
ncbi:flexible cuticle protein 12-like [Vanessa tameamea]|uniref:Flexible cuticle protein 12-like n=1 Tax=Vanessa tameamea TaxID=334116 RepID=A0A8B8HWU5_VANTA|nr:flexible cuticle protein 12-like [Vanessa tameamea]